MGQLLPPADAGGPPLSPALSAVKGGAEGDATQVPASPTATEVPTPTAESSATPSPSTIPTTPPTLLPEESPPAGAKSQFSTDFGKHSVPYSEILSGGPPKDGIPAIDEKFVSVGDHATTGDHALLRDLFPMLHEIIGWHRPDTRYNIHMDPADGLLYAVEPGVQLTWMGAKVNNWVVAPRIGKPAEINTLWYNSPCSMAATNANVTAPTIRAQCGAG